MNIAEIQKKDILDLLIMGEKFATAADEPLDRESLVQHFEWIIEDAHCAAYIARNADGEAAGMISGIWMPTFWDHSKVNATEMWWWVEDDCRGEGVGTMLMDALESWARDVGAWRLYMMTIPSVTPGVGKIYQNRGFREREHTFVKEL